MIFINTGGIGAITGNGTNTIGTINTPSNIGLGKNFTDPLHHPRDQKDRTTEDRRADMLLRVLMKGGLAVNLLMLAQGIRVIVENQLRWGLTTKGQKVELRQLLVRLQTRGQGATKTEANTIKGQEETEAVMTRVLRTGLLTGVKKIRAIEAMAGLATKAADSKMRQPPE